MDVKDSQVAFARTIGQPLEYKFMRAGYFSQREVFRWRTYEDQVVVLGIIEREQAPALDANPALEQAKDMVQVADCQHLSYPCVMIQDVLRRVPRRIEVAHSRFRPPDKSRITENHPRLFRRAEEWSPEDLKRSRRNFALF